MNFGERSMIKSKEKMIQFMREERVGRLATIDKNGYPFITSPLHIPETIDRRLSLIAFGLKP